MKELKKFLLDRGLTFTIICPVLLVVLIVFGICNPDSDKTIPMLIFSYTILIMFSFLAIVGVLMIIKIIKINIDIKKKSVLVNFIRPEKIIVVKESSKYGATYIRAIVIKAEKVYYIIPVINKVFNRKNNVKKFKEECLNISSNLTYMPKSKVVVQGQKAYLNLVNKYLD